MSYGWVVSELHMHCECVLKGFWTSYEWIQNQVLMGSEWVLNNFRLASTWICSDWVLSEFWMSSKWELDGFWVGSEWIRNEFKVNYACVWVSSVWTLNEFYIHSEWFRVLNKQTPLHITGCLYDWLPASMHSSWFPISPIGCFAGLMLFVSALTHVNSDEWKTEAMSLTH